MGLGPDPGLVLPLPERVPLEDSLCRLRLFPSQSGGAALTRAFYSCFVSQLRAVTPIGLQRTTLIFLLRSTPTCRQLCFPPVVCNLSIRAWPWCLRSAVGSCLLPPLSYYLT
jgi:hypothetical protein